MVRCEMCGREDYLTTAGVEGVEMSLCSGCLKYGVARQAAHSQLLPKRQSPPDLPELKIVSAYASLIRSAREKRKMTQEDFAKYLNEKESIIVKWEAGKLKPGIEIAKRLEKILEIRLIESEVKQPFVPEHSKNAGVFTLGDFIKKKNN